MGTRKSTDEMAAPSVKEPLPLDPCGNVLQIYPAITPKASALDTVAVTPETLITVATGASLLVVHARDYGVFLKWATGVANTDNGFDAYIAEDQHGDYAIPEGTTAFSMIGHGGSAIVVTIQY